MALNFKITNSGLALLSQVSTIGPVTITKVGIGSAGYTPSGSETALTTQIKDITPEGSSVPAPGIIHITASDSSADAYTVKEIGLFAGTTLFAICSQTTAILTKSSGNVALFSIDLALSNVPAGSVTIGSASFQYPPATESAQGVAEIATSAEVAAATDDTRIVTPAKLGSFPGFVKKAGDTMTGALVLPGDPTSGLQAATKNYVDARSGVDTVPIGTIHWFTRNTPPDSYLECNGQAVSRTEYDVLFARVGTTFGAGNGSTTFNLPDLRGEFIRGWDNGRGVDVSRLFGSSQAATGIGHIGTDANSNQLALSFDAPDAFEYYNYIGRYDSGQAPTASQRRARVRPRNVALLPCIKAKTLTNVDANLLGIAAQIYVRKEGDSMTGPLVLSGNPTLALHAAAKQYVDAAAAARIARTGDTMTGMLALAADPSSALHAATKQYVDGSNQKSAYGFQVFPSGIVIQWGQGAPGSYAFPIAFPGGCAAIVAVDAGAGKYPWGALGTSRFGYNLWSAGSNCFWIALGF